MALVKQEPSYCNDIAIKQQQQRDPADEEEEDDSHELPATSCAGFHESGEQQHQITTMADDIKPLGPEDLCDLNPDFAVICSFIIQFGDKIDLDLNIERLKSAIEDQSRLDEDLINIHVKLLKKLRRYFVRDQWEKALIRFASGYSYDHAYELESLGYQKCRPSVKLELLRRLLDVQFECDPKFKAAVNLCEASELRLSSMGRDIEGNTYWQKSDKEGNFRVYKEQPLDYKSWKTVCSNVSELKELIDGLEQIKDERVKGEPMLEPYNPFPEIFPEFFKVEERPKQQAIEDKTVSSSKKGRHRGRKKGSSNNNLPILAENDEENEQSNIIQENQKENKPKIETKLSINMPAEQSRIDTASELAITSPVSTESQVKSTLESIINKVVASIEYIIRPLSRNSNEPNQSEDKQPARTPKKPTSKRKREKPVPEELPRRSSSRIQQLQIKKQTEQEEEMKKMIEREQKKMIEREQKKAQQRQQEVISPDGDSRSRSSTSKNNLNKSEKTSAGRGRRKAGWRKNGGKKKISWDKDDSDLSSASSLTESDEDDFEDANDFTIDTNTFDDEFACEDEDTNNEPVIIRRARTARQSLATSETGNLNDTTLVEEDKPCGRCDKSHDPEWILLCDMCDDGYHTSCCLPPLMIIPDGDWYCPSCEHKMLLIRLDTLHRSVSQILAAKEEEERKRQIAVAKRKPLPKAEVAPVKQIPLNGRRSKDILNELNDPIALQRLDECLGPDSESASSTQSKKRAKKGRRPREQHSYNNQKRQRKNYSRKQYSDSEESEDISSPDELLGGQTSEEEELPKTRRARASVSYKFKEYDDLIKSAIRGESDEEASSDDDEQPAPHNYGRGKDMATIEALAYQQENGLAQEPVPAPKASKARRKGRRLNDLDALSEAEDVTSDESFQASATEAEDDDITEEAESEVTDTSIDEILGSFSKHRKKKRNRRNSYESDDSEYQPNQTKRRAATKKFNYKESSGDEDSDIAQPTKKSKKAVLSSDEETEASWKSDQTKSDDDDEDIPMPDDDEVTDEDGSPALGIVETNDSPAAVDDDPSLDESIDELVAPLYRPEPKPITQSSAATIDPMDQLNQYCMDTASESTMYNSFNQILSKNSPPHPSFYGDDDPKQEANNKRKKTAEQTIPSH